MKRLLVSVVLAIGSVGILFSAGTYGISWYYGGQRGTHCADCHEMADLTHAVHGSPHRNVGCTDCHDTSLGTKIRHIAVHLRHRWPEAIRLRDVDVVQMTADCQKCHQHEYATWHAGPHSATYRQIFADPAHNRKRRLMDDCLRCHGMHYDGPVRDLVQPMDEQGPWRVVRSGFAGQPAIPCQACHWIHRDGALETNPGKRISVAGKPLHDSLAFFDRREQMHFAAAALPVPQLYDQRRPVKMSLDRRQALCYQCHAPRAAEVGTAAAADHWGPQVASGDDRTPMGVHEGLSCFSCHSGHNENARASCATCHDKMSNCGLDVEKMDTTYANPDSRHNIHWVQCVDCHTHGIPKPKRAALAAGE